MNSGCAENYNYTSPIFDADWQFICRSLLPISSTHQTHLNTNMSLSLRRTHFDFLEMGPCWRTEQARFPASKCSPHHPASLPAKPENSRTSGELPSSVAFVLLMEASACCHHSQALWRIFFLWLLGSWKSCYAASQFRRAGLPLICCFLMHFCAHFQESFGNLWSSLFGTHLTLCHYVKMASGTAEKSKCLPTYPICRSKVPCCIFLFLFCFFFFFTPSFLMKTSETARIYVDRSDSLLNFSWTVHKHWISELACLLPEYALCNQTKF